MPPNYWWILLKHILEAHCNRWRSILKMCIYIYTWKYVCVYICIYSVYIYVYINIHSMYVHINTHTHIVFLFLFLNLINFRSLCRCPIQTNPDNFSVLNRGVRGWWMGKQVTHMYPFSFPSNLDVENKVQFQSSWSILT